MGSYPECTPDTARKWAMEILLEMGRGVDPNAREREEKASETTLAEAIEWHVAAMQAKECAPRSIECMREDTARHLGDWMARPLRTIKRRECVERHEKVTSEAGIYAANRALANFRAAYNTAMRRLEDLPLNPTIAVTFNKTKRRREPIKWADLPDWKRTVDSIQNPIRRDLQLFLLFTGLRSTDARTVRWEEVNLGDEPREHRHLPPGCMHRPKPKGGEDRAFTVPLSEPVLEILRRRREQNPIIAGDDKGWVFPSVNMRGETTYVRQPREARYINGRKAKILPTPHRLRDTFATAAYQAGIPTMALKLLMNHTLAESNDVTEGYVDPSDIDHLRECVQRVAELPHGEVREENRLK